MLEIMDRIGQQLGKYRLIRLLGHGGAASVYLGQHVLLNTEYAIKVWPVDSLTQEALDEARKIVSLKHRRIIPVHYFDVDESTGLPYLVMEYASGGNLRQKHPEGMILSPSIVCEYIGQVAGALAYAHKKRIVHCDIKPENMLIGQRGRILLGDFGIATVNPPATQSNQQLPRGIEGTIKYMAPEQFCGRPSPKSDQYALAVVAYEWLRGGVPFSDNVPLPELIQQVMREQPQSLTQHGVSPEIEEVVFKALEKDPHKRFPKVKDFARALSNASALPVIGPVPSPASGSPSPIPTPPGRSTRRVFLFGGVAAGLTALLGGGAAWWAITASSPAPKQTPLPSCVPFNGQIASDGLITSGVLSWGADPGKDGASVSGAAPYVFNDANGDLAGFEVDIADAIARLIGITQVCYPTNYKWDIENDLQARRMDVILNGWEITPGRQQNENFSVPYYRYSQQLVVRANDSRFLRYTASSQITLTELKSHNYKFGTGSDYKAADLLRNAGIDRYTSDKPLDDLNNGTVDIIMIDTPMVAYYVQGQGKGAAHNDSLRAIGKPLFADSTSNYVIGFKKDDPNADKLLGEINQALSALKQNGTLKRIYQQWGLWNEFQTEIGIVDCE